MLRSLPRLEDPNLVVGFDNSDDAAVYRIGGGRVMIQTIDLFPPVVDDPYAYGQIAAANALSDLYAMGAEPKVCLNILCFPEDMDLDVVHRILEGGYSKIAEAGAVVGGGHTIKDNEPKFGLCVTGFAEEGRVLANDGAKAGDVLLLTKPIGTGVVNTAGKADLLKKESVDAMVQSMAMLNKYAYEVMKKYTVHSCTDITGFGLLGHAAEMAEGSGLTARFHVRQIPLLPEAKEMASMGIVPGGAYRNRKFLEKRVSFEPGIPLVMEDLCYDPQTSGGLLIAVPAEEADAMLQELQSVLPVAARVGELVEQESCSIHVLDK